jgi:hypothetical protein
MTAQTRQTRPRPARDLGPEPRFDWLPIDSLTVNRDYQRELNTRSGRSLVARIGERFSWAAFAPIVVAPAGAHPQDAAAGAHPQDAPAADGTGRYEILDGQHRWAAARTIPEISRVPCWIVAMESAAAAATAFVAINRDRINLDQYARFKAELLAGEPSALAVKRVCDAARVTIPYHTIQARQMAPRQTLALGAVRALLRTSEDHAVRVLTLVADAAGDRTGEIRSEAVKGVSWALRHPKGAGLTDQEVAAWLGKETNAKRLDRAREMVGQGRAPVTFVAFGRLVLAGLGRLAADGTPPAAVKDSKRILDRVPAVPAPGPYVPPRAMFGDGSQAAERLPKKVNRRCACGAVFATDRVDETACPDCRERA